MDKLMGDYMLWLSNQNGGYGLGSTPVLAQCFLNERQGDVKQYLRSVSDSAKLLHAQYIHSE